MSRVSRPTRVGGACPSGGVSRCVRVPHQVSTRPVSRGRRRRVVGGLIRAQHLEHQRFWRNQLDKAGLVGVMIRRAMQLLQKCNIRGWQVGKRGLGQLCSLSHLHMWRPGPGGGRERPGQSIVHPPAPTWGPHISAHRTKLHLGHLSL